MRKAESLSKKRNLLRRSRGKREEGKYKLGNIEGKEDWKNHVEKGLTSGK